MGKFFYGLAIISFVIALMDSSGDAPAPRREMEATILMLLVPIFGLTGFAISRASTKKCQYCSERIQKDASKCKHCGSDVV